MESIFELIHYEGLTTLKIRYNSAAGKVLLEAGKQWDEGLNWSEYNRSFSFDDLLDPDGKYLNHRETLNLINRHNLADYLNFIVELIKKGKHVGINFYYNREKEIRFMGNIHSNSQGINNRSHAVRSGGIRRHELEVPELHVIEDGLNLSRAMSYKNIGAKIPYGGCKIAVQSKPVDLRDLEELGFLAYAIDSMRCFTGPDMGYPCELADVLKEHFTLNITGGVKSPIGPTGKPTAYGTHLAIKQAVKFKFGSESLSGLKIALQGLGAVGYPLAAYLLEEDVHLFVSEICEENIKSLKAQFPTKKIEVVNANDIYDLEADIFAPCALGGIIDEDKISRMKFKIIMGAANNQLKANSQEEEFRLARLLERQGIIFQCDWVHNVAGVLSGEEEYKNQQNADIRNIIPKVEQLCKENTWNNLNKSKELNLTPTEIAYEEAERIISK